MKIIKIKQKTLNWKQVADLLCQRQQLRFLSCGAIQLKIQQQPKNQRKLELQIQELLEACFSSSSCSLKVCHLMNFHSGCHHDASEGSFNGMLRTKMHSCKIMVWLVFWHCNWTVTSIKSCATCGFVYLYKSDPKIFSTNIFLLPLRGISIWLNIIEQK